MYRIVCIIFVKKGCILKKYICMYFVIMDNVFIDVF